MALLLFLKMEGTSFLTIGSLPCVRHGKMPDELTTLLNIHIKEIL